MAKYEEGSPTLGKVLGIWKKYLTKLEESDIIIKLSNERERERKRTKTFLKKRLDKFEGKWYNIKVVSKETGIQKSLKKLEKSTWQTEKNVVKY